jgi:hypothetical protein
MNNPSILDDPDLYMRLYRLTAKIREILRIQTFGPPEAQSPDDEARRKQYCDDRAKLLAALNEMHGR